VGWREVVGPSTDSHHITIFGNNILIPGCPGLRAGLPIEIIVFKKLGYIFTFGNN
jgi:hypothetical protein